MKTKVAVFLLLIAGALYGADPRAGFCLLPLFDDMFALNKLPDSTIQAQIDRMKTQFGSSRQYFKVGFSGIFGAESNLERNFRMAFTNNIALGVIIANSQTHALDSTILGLLQADIRRYQWRLDGVNWYGVATTNSDGSVEYPGRDFNRVTDSRYATEVRAAYESNATEQADFIVQMNNEYPGVLAAVNTAIEEEQATSGEESDNYLADYSPFAVTEFRDWLRHTGKYDDSTGEFAGQGAPSGITGSYLLINGVWRSPFYDDPTPDDANGTGVSFNQYFGTSFTTWTLRYYDLTAFPNPIPYTNGMENSFDISPESGTGFAAGGFDAPRVRDTTNRYWLAWSWDVLRIDNNTNTKTYPPGDPLSPQFGFRQTMVHNWCSDTLNWAREAGVPANMLYAHQIPAEVVSTTRLRSSASAIWTGSYAPGGTEGITRFGPIDPNLLQKYARRWGIFEWHPQPGGSGSALYNYTVSALNSYYWAGARVLFPGWWSTNTVPDATFPLADSTFATGIKDWLTAQADRSPPVMGSGSGLPIITNGSSAHATGWIQPFFSETYTFYPDPGTTYVIDGTAVTDGSSASFSLQAGHLYPVAFSNGYNSSGFPPTMKWSSTTMPKEPIQLSQLYPVGDTDGDGMSDYDEALAGRDARNPADMAFLFDTDGDNEGWSGSTQLASVSVSNGVYQGTSTGSDPQITNSGFSFNTSGIKGFLVRMKCTKTGPVDLFFGNLSVGYSATRQLTANLTLPNTWSVLFLPATNVNEWQNFTVTQFRLDPTSQSNATFQIDWIRATDGDVDHDGIPDVDELNSDANSNGIPDVIDPAPSPVLTVSTPSGATSLPAAGTYTYDYGTTLSVFVNNRTFTNGLTGMYVCTGWVGSGSAPASGSTTNTGSFTLTQNSTVTWLWKTNYWLGASVTGEGSVTPSNSWYSAGTNAQLTAVPRSGYYFSGWSGDTSGNTNSAQMTLPMTASRFVTADFEPIIKSLPYTETFESMASGENLIAPGNTSGWYNATNTLPVMNAPSATVTNVSYTLSGALFHPVESAAHTKVLNYSAADLTVQVATNPVPVNTTVDFLFFNPDLKAVAPDKSLIGTCQNAFYVNTNGWLNVWCGRDASGTNNTWLAYTNTLIGTSAWIRITCEFDYTTDTQAGHHFFKVTLNGAGLLPGTNGYSKGASSFTADPSGGWLLCANQNPEAVQAFGVKGDGMLDDLVVTTNTVTDFYKMFLLTASAAGNGAVSPISSNVVFGGSAVFTLTADRYYRILSLTTNGTPVAGITFDNTSAATNFTWNNVQTTGTLAAAFTAQVAAAPGSTPYWWLAQYGLTNFAADAVADTDGDGLLNWQEYIAGTNPTNPASVFRISTADVEPQGTVIRWTSVSNRLYSLSRTTNLLESFTAVADATNLPATPPENIYTNQQNDPSAFYKISVQQSGN